MSGRRLIVVRGDREETLHHARSLVAGTDAVFVSTHARRLLGRAFDAVVIDAHDGLDADVIGQAEGLVWRGGAMVLCMPEAPARDRRLAVFGVDPRTVGTRFWERFERKLAAHPLETSMGGAQRDAQGTEEQRDVVERLRARFSAQTPSLACLLADRGRGKSSALGLALREVRARIAVTAPSEPATQEIARFSGLSAYVAPNELARGGDFDVIVVDEAAQLPVPLLQRIALRHPRARIAFATTTRGYEGTGRGFVLRFLAWARKQERSLEELRLSQPIRWDEDDPLERFVFDALALDAEPADATSGDTHNLLIDPDLLATDERLLRDVFGLLVHAHYRTRPSDLARMLDAPNLKVHASIANGRAIGATLVDVEGSLPRETCEAMAHGELRIHGHALADTLVTHAARADAGELAMIRSVRIAVHPEARRRGIGRSLVEHVHASYAPDLFGTMFGATPELLRFRRSVGYELARVGVSRGARSGEPAAVMLRPVTPGATKLLHDLRDDLARNLAAQRALLEADDELPLDAELTREIDHDLPRPPPLDERDVRATVERYVRGAQPADAIAHALSAFVSRADLSVLSPRERALVELRVVQRASWAAAAAGYPTVAAAMRALRPAIAKLLAGRA